MENASKALIIAGAILISIILISIGIIVVNSANDLIGSSQEKMNTQEIQMFNKQFESYSGKQRGSTIKSLMSTVSASNSQHDEDHQVLVTGPNSESDTDIIRDTIKPTSSYEVSMKTDPTSGLIKEITITSASSGTSTKK